MMSIGFCVRSLFTPLFLYFFDSELMEYDGPPTVNMKFTLDWCVFGYPVNTEVIPANQKCAEVCAGPDNSAKISLTNRYLQTDATLQYSYCNGLNIQNILDNCAACLNTVPNAKALGHCEWMNRLQKDGR